MVGNDARRDLAPARAAGFQTALFAGDARSLRGAELAGEATAVVTSLDELPRLLAPKLEGHPGAQAHGESAAAQGSYEEA